MDASSRFFAKVNKTSGCWLWTASKRRGYGAFYFEGRHWAAHRWAYEHLVGPIPAGLQLDHLCRVPACVNPNHLEPVTGRVNLLRGDTFQAANARKTRCVNGHPFSPENTYIIKDGKRACRTCRREAMYRYRARYGRTGSATNPFPPDRRRKQTPPIGD